MNDQKYRLDDIVEMLDMYGQRATYAAVGALVGRLARSVMSGRTKSPENSLVVSKITSLPTGYLAHEVHPLLKSNPIVISSAEDLAAWLRSRKHTTQPANELATPSVAKTEPPLDFEFLRITSDLGLTLAKLTSGLARKPLALPADVPNAGVYVFYENAGPLYVGRSNRIKKRLGNHCRPGASHKMAAFAFRLAREATGNVRPTYKKAGSRSDLISSPIFLKAFEDAKERIRAMTVRYVEERDPLRQCLLEIYVAVTLRTPYNDFDTH